MLIHGSGPRDQDFAHCFSIYFCFPWSSACIFISRLMCIPAFPLLHSCELQLIVVHVISQGRGIGTYFVCNFLFISNGPNTSKPFGIAGRAFILFNHSLMRLNCPTLTPAHSAQLIHEKFARSATVILLLTIHAPRSPELDLMLVAYVLRRSSST